MSDELLKSFVDLKRQIRVLEDQVAGIMPKVIDQVRQRGGDLVVSEARLVFRTRDTYEFSNEGFAKLVTKTEFVITHLEGHTRTHRAHRRKGEGFKEVRKKHPRAYMPWDQEEKDTLERVFNQGKSVRELAEMLQRQVGGIRSQLKKIGLQ
jgi:hypothetical protein